MSVAIMEDLKGDEVVISGISGIFPNSDSVSDFEANLFNKVDMITTQDPGWTLNDKDVPKYIGQIKGAKKFDAQFFGVTFHLACVLDPMGRKIMEHTYGAIFDSENRDVYGEVGRSDRAIFVKENQKVFRVTARTASGPRAWMCSGRRRSDSYWGTSLQPLRGKKVGVFIGSAFSDNSSLQMFNINKRSDHVINGGSRAMLANRVSYWIDGKGPSYGIDNADASSTQCLELAYNHIVSGDCDAAIVGGCNYSFYPTLNLNLRRAGLLCLDGKTKCFDKNADGYVRANASTVIFLQKARDAHRIYSQVYYAKGTYKMRPDAQFLPVRQPEDTEDFLRKVYSEAKLDPKKVEYVEAHGAAIAKADINELEAISNIFAKDKSIKIGSVKSNMGNSEAASGLCSIIKLCLAYYKGKIPSNLHYNEPHNQIPAVCDGRIQVLSEPTAFDREFTAINSFSYTGTNFHIILKGHFKPKDLEKYKCKIPRLILISGRQEVSVQKVIDILKNHPIDPEEIGLLNKVYEHNITGHIGRGYVLLDSNVNNETVSISESVQYYPGVKRPLWFVYSGMGSQWAGMGTDLMRIPKFAAAIYKCHEALKPKGIDLLRVITELDNTIFDNTLNAFVGISAIQIGLTDVIKEMGIVPDSIIGHSLGEMACAYHDNTFTAEQLILATYTRGKVVNDNKKVNGSMAAVGLGYNELASLCPEEIDIACHNSSESATISGPSDKIKEFVSYLTKRGVFAREVQCGGIAYHSRYIAHCEIELHRRLSEIIKNPKKRSSKWISTSVPQEMWNEHDAVYSSATYHTNNLLRPVLFEEMSKFIPDNAIVVEIAPHGLMQAILKRSHKDCTHIPLTRRGNRDSVKFLLESIGKIYEAGVNPKVEVLYPKIEFPVSTETPLLSHFADWEYSEDWPDFVCPEKNEVRSASARNYVISVHDDDYSFLRGHVRDGINVLPESAILVFVWETLCMKIGESYRDYSVIFKDIQFHTEVNITTNDPLRVYVAISSGSDKFEVCQDDVRIASGTVSIVKVLQLSLNVYDYNNTQDDFVEEITLKSEDVYNILKSRGYSYKSDFRSIQQTNLTRDQGYIEVNKNWITFLDSLIQLNTIAADYDGIAVPKLIRSLKISHLEQNTTTTFRVNGVPCYNAHFNKINGILRCAGVEIDNMIFVEKPVLQYHADVLLSKAFYPHYSMEKVDLKTALRINLQIVAENTSMNEIMVTELVTSNKSVNRIIKEISHSIPNISIHVSSLFNFNKGCESLLKEYTDIHKTNIFVIENVLGNKRKLESLRNLSKDSYVLAIETGLSKPQVPTKEYFNIVSAMSDGKQILMLLNRQSLKDVTYIRVNCVNKLEWVSRVYEELNKTKRVILVSERQPYCGALGFVQNLRKNGVEKIALMAIDDFCAPSFNPELIIYKEQLEKNLTINILKKGEWGGFYYQPAIASINLRNATLTSTSLGDLDSLAWQGTSTVPVSKNLVQVYYSGLSLNDVRKAVSICNHEEISFGMDFSGLDTDGDRVMGLVPTGALSSTVQADPILLWPVPEHWSLQDAATVPLPYAMAYYCLCIKNQIFKENTYLIIGGAGAFGQAVISLCLSAGCTVFTTVSSEYKKEMLLRLFPELDESKIGYSQDESFLNVVQTQTKGIGCNFVINISSGTLREIAMKCVAFSGVFLDLSYYDMTDNQNIGMSYLEHIRSYMAVDFSNIFRPEYANDKKVIQHFIYQGIAKGFIKPICRVEYSPTDISRAFRFLSSSKHIGKVLIKMRSPEIIKEGFRVTPSIQYCSTGVHIVICDETGIGFNLVDLLIKRGVKKIVLHLRSKVSGYFQAKFVSWQKYDVVIRISSDELESVTGCIKLVKEAAKIGPVKAIFLVHVPENVKNTHDSVLKLNKSNTVINLDTTTRNHCNELSHFVLLTTNSKNAGDEFAISVFEKICRDRFDIGLPALLVKTDGIVGLSDDMTMDANSKQILTEFFKAMETGLHLKYSNILSYNFKRDTTNNYETLEKLTKILGIPKIEGIPNNATISDINLMESNLLELQNFIRSRYQINYPIEKIQRMTINSIINIATEPPKTSKPHEGLEAFYTCVDNEKDHIDISHPIVPMITLVNNGIENVFDSSATYVTLIPGFEGRHQIFNLAAERLKVPAVAVQLAPDLEGNTIAEMAAVIREFMKTKFETRTKFYLLGYSFGVNIALELAVILEREGHIGVVYCLDSSPDALRSQLKSYIGDLTLPQLENVVIEHFYNLITQHDPVELKHDLDNTETWLEKVNVCLKKMTGLSSYSHRYQKYILESAYKRILLAKEYRPNFKLDSEIVLMKGVAHPKADELAEDYYLSKYTKKPVRVFEIDSDHTLAPYDCRVSNIVNKMLDQKLLEDFNKKSLCDLYRL